MDDPNNNSDKTRVKARSQPSKKDEATRIHNKNAASAAQAETVINPAAAAKGISPSEDETQLIDNTALNTAQTLSPDEETLVSPSVAIGDETELSDAPITKIDQMERTPRLAHGETYQEIDVGSTIRHRFVLKQVLGRGGMGAVFSAVDLIKEEAGDNNPYVAIKLLAGDFKEHPHAFVTLQREAKKTQELAHPNIVTVYDFDKDDTVVYLTMEKLSGAPLIDVIKGQTDVVLSYKDKLDIISQIAKGLAYAHSKGIVHSDLKPANLFLTDDGVLKVLDFGIARAANTELYQDTFDVGELGALTATYASPEMLRFESPHPSDDIYALGIIACELLGGAHPFDRKDAKTAIENNLTCKLPELKNLFLKKVICSSLELERKDRIADANVFLKKFTNASAAPKRLLSIAAIGILAISINFFTLYYYGNDEVPFSELPKEQQAQFHQLIDEGNTALKFQDLQEAVVKFNSAYEIHTTHDDIKKARKKIVGIFQNNLTSAEDDKRREFFQTQIQELKAYPAFADFEVNQR